MTPELLSKLLGDLPALLALYGKITGYAAHPETLTVTPALVAGDKTDEALAIAQALTPEFIGLVRTIIAQTKPAAA